MAAADVAETWTQDRSPDAKCQPMSRRERRKSKEQARVQALKPLEEQLHAQDPAKQLVALETLWEGLQSSQTSLDTLLCCDILPWVLQLSQELAQPEIQAQALAVLRCFTEGTPQQTARVVEEGALKRLIPLLAASRARVREQVLIIMTNVVNASEDLRDKALTAGAVDYVIGMFHASSSEPPVVTRQAARLLRASCHPGLIEPMPRRLLGSLGVLLASTDDDTLAQVCSTLASFRYQDPQHLAVLLLHGSLERLVLLMGLGNLEVAVPAARALNRVACSSKTGMQALLVSEPLPTLKDLLGSEDPALQREGSALVANILAFGGPHAKEVLDSGCASILVACLQTVDEEAKRSAARGVAALARRGALAQLPELSEVATVEAFLKILRLGLDHASLGTVRAYLDYLEEVAKYAVQPPKPAMKTFKEVLGRYRHLLEELERTCPDLAVVSKVRSVLEMLKDEASSN